MTTNETPTPRTDAIADYWLEPGMAAEREIVPASFARELERELSALSKAADKLEEDKEYNARLCESLSAELAAERALADRLAETLKQSTYHLADHMPCEEGCQCTRRRIVKVNKQALAAWKEARREA